MDDVSLRTWEIYRGEITSRYDLRLSDEALQSEKAILININQNLKFKINFLDVRLICIIEETASVMENSGLGVQQMVIPLLPSFRNVFKIIIPSSGHVKQNA